MKNKFLYSLIVFAFFVFTPFFSSASGAVDWFYESNNSSGMASVLNTNIDSNSNSYYLGIYQGFVDFNGEEEGGDLFNEMQSTFLLKLNQDGQFEWVKEFEAGGISFSFDIDSNDNIYVPVIFPTEGGMGTDSTLYKINPDGSYIAIDVSQENFEVQSLSIDNDNNLYLLGVSFESELSSYSVLKLNSSYSPVWYESFSTSDSLTPFRIYLDKYNNIYIKGTMEGSVDFNGEEEGGEAYSSSLSYFILKLNSDGDFIFVKNLDFYVNQNIFYLLFVMNGNDLIDEDGNIYFSGFSDGVNYLIKIDAEGSTVWEKEFNMEEILLLSSLFIDKEKNIYLAGIFNDSIDFNGEEEGGEVSVEEGYFGGFFLLKLNTDGDFVWVKNIGIVDIYSSMDIFSFNLISDFNNNIYISGAVGAILDLDDFEEGLVAGEDENFSLFALKMLSENSIDFASFSQITSSLISKDSAVLNAEVLDDGGEEPSGLGFEYGLDELYGDLIEVENYSSGTFSYELIDLTCNTTYHYRAYATNSAGTSYSDSGTFTTLECPKSRSRVIGSVARTITPPSTKEEIKQFVSEKEEEIENPIITPSFSMIYTRLLKQGMRGDDIKQIQSYLSSKGYDLGIVDGIFGPKTKQSVIAFQKANGLTPDGLIGKFTIGKINELK